MTMHELEDQYREFLNEVCAPVQIGILEYTPAHVLESVDPIAFREGFFDWINDHEIDIDDL